MKYKIYLLNWEKCDTKDISTRLMGLNKDDKIDMSTYHMAYSDTDNLDTTLDDIYYKFNMEHPVNYLNRSLSVGDIIMLNVLGKEEYYSVQMMGFLKLENNNIIKAVA